MNSTPHQRLRARAVFFLILLSLGAAVCLKAQTSPIAPRLPPGTIGFLAWRGSAALSANARNNHVIQLLSDPAMTPLWLGMAADFPPRKRPRAAPAAVLSLPEVVSLLENPAVLGILEPPPASETGPGRLPAAGMAVFLVYDATGKTGLIHQWEAAIDGRAPNPAKRTHFDFHGTSVEVRSHPHGETFWAMAGNYFLASDQKYAIEQLITQFAGSARPTASLAEQPAYARVQRFVGPGAALEFFARMPHLGERAAANGTNQPSMNFLRDVHLEKVRAAGGSVRFAGPAMHIRGAIFGNTQPTGPFDIAGPSAASFPTEAIAQGSPEFSVWRWNLAALYNLMYGAILPNLSSQQAANVAAAEAAAEGFLGMSIPRVLDLFTGEMASASFYSPDGSEERVLAATIQKPQAVVRALRRVLGPMTLAEDTDGDATTLAIAIPKGDRDNATGLKRRTMYYVAVTPGMLLVAPRQALLRKTLDRLSGQRSVQALPAKGVLVDAQYAPMRSLLPARLSGLSAMDISQIPWASLLAKATDRAAPASPRATGTTAPGANHGPNARPPALGWLRGVDPNVISRHLHIAVSGWWKDTNGVYFDSYVQ